MMNDATADNTQILPENLSSAQTNVREQPPLKSVEETVTSLNLRAAHLAAGLDPRDLEYLDATPHRPTDRTGRYESTAEVTLPNEVAPSSASQDPWLLLDSDGDGLTNHEEILIGTNPNSGDTDRDGVGDYQEVLNGTNPFHHDTDRDGAPNGVELQNGTNLTIGDESLKDIFAKFDQLVAASPILSEKAESDPAQIPLKTEVLSESSSQVGSPTSSLRDSYVQDPAIPIQDVVLETNGLTDIIPEAGTKQSSFVDTLYQRLAERSELDPKQVTLSVYQGPDLLYRGNVQAERFNHLTPEQHDLLNQTLSNPAGLQGELKITVNDQVVFHVDNGELKVDQFGLTPSQLAEPQTQVPTQSAESVVSAVTTYQRYQDEISRESSSSTQPDSIDGYEQMAQKALEDGLSQGQASQVLKQHPFYQTLTQGVGQPIADRYNQHLLSSLEFQSNNDRGSSLTNRVENLESFKQQLSSHLEVLNHKLDKLSQSKAFETKSPQLNQFLKGVRESTQQAGKTLSDRVEQLSTQVTQHLHQMRESLSNSWQAAKATLRQKAGEISLSVINASAKAATQWFGQESKEGLRVIDATNGQRLGLNQQGDIQIARKPEIQATSEYQRLSQSVDANLPPSAQVKQIAQIALKEQFTTSQVQNILSEAPKFKEINSVQGSDKASQFANVAIAAAQRQNAVDAQAEPSKQRESQSQKQFQA